MTTTTGRAAAPLPAAPATRTGPDVEIVLPVHNEQSSVDISVRRLHDHLLRALPFSFRITIADNASTDGTWARAVALADELPGVRALHLSAKGRGRALRTVWSGSDATVLAYMDVDLSTDLAALLPLLAPLLSGHSDLAIGTRLSRGSRVVRGAKREIISRSYNLLLRGTLAARFSDAQCGFKAIRVDLVAAALADLRGMARLGRALATGALPVAQLRSRFGRDQLPAGMAGQLVRFAAVGVASTVVHLGLFWLLRGVLGPLTANLVALLVATAGNTAANRRVTFGITDPRGRARHQLEGFAVLGLGLALTTGALGLLGALVPDPGRTVELGALVVANLAATVLRFVLFRAWVFHPRRRP